MVLPAAGNVLSARVFVTPGRYLVDMEAKVIAKRQDGRRWAAGRRTAADARSDAELERWLADAGVAATVVAACPDPGCALCPAGVYEAA